MAALDMVVCNYQTPHDLGRFCHSVLRHPPTDNWTLTIVNVESRHEDAEVADWVLDEMGTKVAVEAFRDNVGYARACNRGALYGDSPYLVLFNADVEVSPDSLDACVEALELHPEWGILGPRQVDERGRLVHGGVFGTHTAPAHRDWFYPDDLRYRDVREAITVSGSVYFVRRSVWEELTECPLYRQVAPGAEGAFLPTRHYFEETYCSYHAAGHGHKVIYYGPVCMLHRWHQASPVGGWAERQFPFSQQYFRQACDAHGLAHD